MCLWLSQIGSVQRFEPRIKLKSAKIIQLNKNRNNFLIGNNYFILKRHTCYLLRSVVSMFYVLPPLCQMVLFLCTSAFLYVAYIQTLDILVTLEKLFSIAHKLVSSANPCIGLCMSRCSEYCIFRLNYVLFCLCIDLWKYRFHRMFRC